MRKEKILALTTFAILLASCSNDDEIPRFENLEGTPIVIKAGVNNMITRAGWDSSNLPDRFIVSIDQDGTEYDYENVMMYKKADNSYAPSGTALIWGSNTHQATIKAYYLGEYNYSSSLAGSKNLPMYGQTSESSFRKYDYLGACSAVEGDIQISGSAVNINFRHLACKLDVKYTWSNELKSIDDKNILECYHEGFSSYLTINFENGTVEKTKDDSYSYCFPYLYSNADGTYTSEFLFAPYYSSPKIRIETNIEGEERKFEVNVPEPAGGFKSGHRYTLNVCVGGNSAQAGTVNIAQGWDTNTSDGSFEME